jgi:hypothetical protein
MAAPECAGGSLDIDSFKTYISHFLRYGSLSEEDLMVMPYLFYYQITVADYFGQLYMMDEENGRQLLRDSYFFCTPWPLARRSHDTAGKSFEKSLLNR